MSFTEESSAQAHSCPQRGCRVPWSSSGTSRGKAGCSRLTAQVAGEAGAPSRGFPAPRGWRQGPGTGSRGCGSRRLPSEGGSHRRLVWKPVGPSLSAPPSCPGHLLPHG